MGIEEKAQQINDWLRHHPDYTITLNLCDVYAVISIRIARKGELVEMFWGDHLEKRLDQVIKFLQIDEWRP